MFLDRWYLVPGLPWPQKLEARLRDCRAVVVCVGAGEMGPWQQREAYVALERQGSQDVVALRAGIFDLLWDVAGRAEMSANCPRITVEEYSLEIQARRYVETLPTGYQAPRAHPGIRLDSLGLSYRAGSTNDPSAR